MPTANSARGSTRLSGRPEPLSSCSACHSASPRSRFSHLLLCSMAAMSAGTRLPGWSLILAFKSRVTLSKSLGLAGPWFPHLYRGAMRRTHGAGRVKRGHAQKGPGKRVLPGGCRHHLRRMSLSCPPRGLGEAPPPPGRTRITGPLPPEEIVRVTLVS